MKRMVRELPVLDSECCAPRRSIGVAMSRDSADIAEGARLFRALADETRLTILRQLRDQGEVCACEFVDCCDVGQPTVSHHLKVLRDAGLVAGDKRGQWVYYALNPSAFERVRQLLP